MDNLFGNISLDNQDFIEIPDTVETPTTNEKVVDTPAKDKPVKDTGEIIEDDFIEITVGKTADKKSEEAQDDDDFNPEGFTEDNKDDGTPPDKTKGNSSSSPFKSFAKALSEEEFLPSFTDEEYEALVTELGSESEALMELSRRSIVEEINAYKEGAEEDFKAFLEARDSGIDLRDWSDIYSVKKEIGKITDDSIEDDEDVQKSLVTQYLKRRGMTNDEIVDTIEAYETTGKLLDNAKKAHKNLMKQLDADEAQLKLDKVENDKKLEKQREDNIKSLKKEIEASSELIPGIKINKQTKDSIFKSITEPVKKGPNGELLNATMAKRMENPIRYAIIENYLLEMGVFDGKWDKILSRQRTKAIADLEKSLSANNNTDFKSGKATLGSGSSDDDIEISLKNFK